jgi:hypothetical protein
MDSFSKFVAFYSVRNINSEVVCDILESQYFTACGVPKSIFKTLRRFSGQRNFIIFAFDEVLRELTLSRP